MRAFSLLFIGLTVAILFFWPAPEPDRRILFIGNSFTHGGNVPEQVRQIAAAAAVPVNYEVVMHVRGGTALFEHLAETDPLATIAQGNWDVVVLQDASHMPFSAETRAQMRQATLTLAAAAHDQGAELLFFAHWPPYQEAHAPVSATARIETAYQALARETGGQVARVGRLWLLAEGAGHSGLYAEDEHHASITGAYAAALAITTALGDVDPATSSWAPDGVGTDLAYLTHALAPQIAAAQ